MPPAPESHSCRPRRSLTDTARAEVSPMPPAPEAEHVDGPGPGPDLGQPLGDGPTGELLRVLGGLQRRVPPRQPRREHRGVRAPGAVGGPVREPLARDLDDLTAVEEQVGRGFPVATRDDDIPRAERVDTPDERRGVVVGLGTCAPGRRRSDRPPPRAPVPRARSGSRRSPAAAGARSATAARPARAAPPRTRRPSPDRSRPASPAAARRARPATAPIVSTVPSIPILTASTPMSAATARTCATMTSGGIVWTAVTPTVFWAVIAVIAVIPCTPQAANAFRSAWIPAPPPESDPAIDSTRGRRRLGAVTAPPVLHRGRCSG